MNHIYVDSSHKHKKKLESVKSSLPTRACYLLNAIYTNMEIKKSQSVKNKGCFSSISRASRTDSLPPSCPTKTQDGNLFTLQPEHPFAKTGMADIVNLPNELTNAQVR
jgi:hypothetical protein